MAASRLGYLYLAFFSKPKTQRSLYRQIAGRRPTRIVELGIGSANRAERMIRVAQRYANGGSIHYTGVDLFESDGSNRPHISLKEAHRRLRATGAHIRLIPGDSLSALTMASNSLTATDLMIVSADQTGASLDGAWFFIPRMLQQDSLVLREETDAEGQFVLRPVPRIEIEKLARTSHLPRRAA